jgi:hypothetical protein
MISSTALSALAHCSFVGVAHASLFAQQHALQSPVTFRCNLGSLHNPRHNPIACLSAFPQMRNLTSDELKQLLATLSRLGPDNVLPAMLEEIRQLVMDAKMQKEWELNRPERLAEVAQLLPDLMLGTPAGHQLLPALLHQLMMAADKESTVLVEGAAPAGGMPQYSDHGTVEHLLGTSPQPLPQLLQSILHLSSSLQQPPVLDSLPSHAGASQVTSTGGRGPSGHAGLQMPSPELPGRGQPSTSDVPPEHPVVPEHVDKLLQEAAHALVASDMR